MRLPFLKSAMGGKPDQIMAVDLGSRTSKAVCVQRRAQGLALKGYAFLDAPIYEKTLPPELLSEHLKSLSNTLQPTTRNVALTVGVNDAHVRHTDIPRMPVSDMRQVLKLNSKTYLQQDLPGHVFDCYITRAGVGGKPGAKVSDANGVQKLRVLVAGARKQLVDDLVQGAKGAGLIPECLVPAVIGPVNTFEKAVPQAFEKEAVALVDLGFKNTTICIMLEGELMLSRVVAIGGDRMTNGLAETLGISYAEADGIKIGMPSEVQSQLESLLLPLGRELRASIDFFEHQYDRPLSQVFLTGGPARSEFIVQRLHQELMVECKVLNPCSFLQMELPPQQAAELEQVAPQLTVALGAALAAF